MFGFGNPLSGITSAIKLAAISAAVLAVVGYLAVQRADTITAATAEQQIDDLLGVIEVNKARREAAETLAQQDREAAERYKAEKEEAAKDLAESLALIDGLQSTAGQECKVCGLDSLLPERPQ